MHRQLENYLTELAEKLSGLPEARRTEELLEMREHLLAAFASSVEKGQTEEDASASVISQFGTPEIVGDQTVKAWERGETNKKRIFWAVTLFAFLGMYGANYLQRTILIPQLMLLMSHKPMTPGYSGLVNCAGFVMTREQVEVAFAASIVSMLASSILMAWACGIAVPRIAVKVVIASSLLGFAFDLLIHLYRIVVIWRPYTLEPTPIDWGYELSWLPFALAFTMVSGGIMILTAWAASRRRERQGPPLRPVSD